MGGNFLKAVLESGTVEHTRVVAEFQRTMPNARLMQIERVQNRYLLQSFHAQRQLLSQKSGAAAPHERLLWHGTRASDPVQIMNSEEGFDHRCARNGMWGVGSYFAESAVYLDCGPYC